MEPDMRSIQVIATTYDGTRAAIETAILLARASGVPLGVLIPEIVPYPSTIGDSRDPVDAIVDTYKHFIDELGGGGYVRICRCARIEEVIDCLTGPDMTVVVGGPSGRWRMSPEERFANRLSRLGRRVLFASTGPSPTSRRTTWAAALVCILALSLASSVHAEPQSPASAYQFGGFVDVADLSSSTDPPNHLFRNRGTTPRLDEVDVNMAAAYVRKPIAAAAPIGFEATVQAGEDAKIFGFSPTAPNIGGARVLTHLGPMNVSYRAPLGRGLTMQGGIFSSLIGYDSLYAKDNVTYTRPWGADYTPYLMLGVNAAYPVTDRLTATAIVVNGYWHLAHANDVPSLGGQLAYAPAAGLTVKQTVLYGPHQANTSIGLWRVLSDTIVERKLERVTAAGELQVGGEQVDGADRAWWIAVQTPVHWTVAGPWSVTIRPEWCRDSAGRWTGFDQTVAALTTTLEYRWTRRQTSARLRGEYRYDRSTGPGGGFFSGSADAAGLPALTPGQHLAIAAVIVTFDAAVGGR
jgi:hypothetical protein